MAPAQLFFVPHTHWDREWYYPFEVFREKLVRLVDKLVGIMRDDPDWKYFLLDGQTIVLEDYQEISGQNPEFLKLIREGRIGIGPWYDLPDEFLVSGESIIRNLKRGTDLCRGLGVEPVKVGYLPDMFGHISQMPQIFNGFGLKDTVVWRGMPNMDKNQFRWKTRDGSEVFAAFLPIGYGLVADLPESPEELVRRLNVVLQLLKIRDDSGVYLLMFGNDHLVPDPNLAPMLKKAGTVAADFSMKIDRLENYFAAIKAAAGKVPEHSGELRSTAKTQILPGVASARLYLKKLNHDADTLLCKYLEPISTLARMASGPDISGRLNYLWKLLLQNHPHDSICGCSVDEVHSEMETRFKKFFELGWFEMNQALVGLTDISAPKSEYLTVWNPYAAGDCAIIEFDDEFFGKSHLVLEDERGKKFPLERGQRLVKEELLYQASAPAQFVFLPLAWFDVDQIFGLYINDIKTKKQGNQLVVDFYLSSQFLNFPIKKQIARIQEITEKEKVNTVLFRVFRTECFRTIAVVDSLRPASLSTFKVRKEKTETASEISVSADSLENKLLRLSVDGEGKVRVLDKQSGREIVMEFSDRGDRGDSYNYDPIPGDVPITRPDKFKIKSGPTGKNFASLDLEHTYRLPAELAPDRLKRSAKKIAVPLRSRVTVYAGSRRVDFETSFANPAKDHRLQADFFFPARVDDFWCESGFDLVKRRIVKEKPAVPEPGLDLAKLILGCEADYASGPIQNFACLGAADSGMALASRGLKEVDTEKYEDLGRTRLSLTLCRSVGYLARGDLKFRTNLAGPPTETPGAQCLREFNWNYSLILFNGPVEEAPVFSEAYHFAFPPRAFPGKPRVQMPFTFDGPKIILSALYFAKDGRVIARFFNSSFENEKLELALAENVASATAVSLEEKPVSRPDFKQSGKQLEALLRPGEIFTLALELAGTGPE